MQEKGINFSVVYLLKVEKLYIILSCLLKPSDQNIMHFYKSNKYNPEFKNDTAKPSIFLSKDTSGLSLGHS